MPSKVTSRKAASFRGVVYEALSKLAAQRKESLAGLLDRLACEELARAGVKVPGYVRPPYVVRTPPHRQAPPVAEPPKPAGPPKVEPTDEVVEVPRVIAQALERFNRDRGYQRAPRPSTMDGNTPGQYQVF